MQTCIWLGKVSETGENYVATDTGVQKYGDYNQRPRTKQSFPHTLGATTEHSTIVREEKIYARLRTADERDGRHRRGTRNKTTTHYVTSTTSVDIDVKFTTTTG